MSGPDRIVADCGFVPRENDVALFKTWPDLTEYIRRDPAVLAALPDVQAIVADAVKAEREAIITHIGGRVDHVEDAAKWGGSKQYLQSLKGGVTELNHLAAAIRKRGEG